MFQGKSATKRTIYEDDRRPLYPDALTPGERIVFLVLWAASAFTVFGMIYLCIWLALQALRLVQGT